MNMQYMEAVLAPRSLFSETATVDNNSGTQESSSHPSPGVPATEVYTEPLSWPIRWMDIHFGVFRRPP